MANAIKVAIDALQAKTHELIAERDELQRRMLSGAVRDVQIERDINGCIAGAKALGGEIELPSHSLKLTQQMRNSIASFVSYRNAIAALLPTLKDLFGVEDAADADTDEDAVDGDAEAGTENLRIADIVLARLKEAGARGTKAAEIRRYIQRTYHRPIHEKTVGMTLYRLQKDQQVRRDGHTWFLVSSEAKDPGAATPGLVELD